MHHPARAVDPSNDKALRRQNNKQGNARRWGQPTTGIVGKLDREPTSILAALASVARAARLSTAWVPVARRMSIARALGECAEGLGNPMNRAAATVALLSIGGMYLTRAVRRALVDAGWE